MRRLRRSGGGLKTLLICTASIALMTGAACHRDTFVNAQDQFVTGGLDAVFVSFGHADGRTAIEAFDSSSELGNLLQLQVGADEATIIGNDNDNVASALWRAA